MLKVYRRHNPARCEHTERTWRRCSCPLWADGTLAGKRYHKTLHTRNWDAAQKTAQKMEAEGKPRSERKSLLEACADFESDAEIGRGLSPATVNKYKLLFKNLKAFAENDGIRFIDECDVGFLRKFRESWTVSPITASKRLEHLSSFLRL